MKTTSAHGAASSRTRVSTIAQAQRGARVRAIVLLTCVVAVACSRKPEPVDDVPAPDVVVEADVGDVAPARPSAPPIASLPPDKQLLALASEPVPWTELGELGVSLYDARLLLHTIQGGPVIDLGEAPAVKNIQGRWRAPWLPAEWITEEQARADDLPQLAGRAIVWNEGAGATLRFPLPDDLPQDVPYRLLVRLRPKNNPRVQIDLNDQKNLATVELDGSWQTISVPVPVKALRFGGENALGFVFGGSFFEGTQRVAARFDDVRLVPEPQVKEWTNVPPPRDIAVPDARILTTSQRALGLAAPVRYDAYVVLPQFPRLRLFLGPAPYTQTPTRFKLGINSDEHAPVVLFDDELQPGDPWKPLDFDLAEFEGQAVRISFEVVAGSQGPTGNIPAVYVGEPAIVIVRPSTEPKVGSNPEALPERIVVVGIDALRADRVSPDGTFTHSATPNLSKLANEGVRAEAIVQGPGTVVPTASVLTGAYGQRHGVIDTITHLRTSFVTLGDVFDEAGWETGFLSTDPYITLDRGFAQGFDRYRNLVEEQGPARTDRLIDAAVRIVKKKSARNRLLYIQVGGLRLPHQPSAEALAQFYTGAYAGPISIDSMMNPVVLPSPLSEEDRRYLSALYDAELFEIDQLFGRLMQALAETGDMSKTLVVVLGMHGEPLGEDPSIGYGERLSDPELRVPAVFWFPARWGGGVRPAQCIELVDVLPTIVELAGLARPATAQGADLAKVLDGRRDNSATPAYSLRTDTHRSVSLGRYHYLLRSGDNDLLFDRKTTVQWRDGDRRATAPIAHRALRDALAIHLAHVEVWDKDVQGTPVSPRSPFAPFAWERGW